MNKSLRIPLVLAALAALLLMVFLCVHYLRGNQELSALEAEVEASRTAWETTAAEKEALQAELKQVSNDLKEANLSLSESTERADELRADIETRKEEIAALEARLGDPVP